MNTKLTLSLDKAIIEEAKKFASEKGSSLSELVENYFKLLIEKDELTKTPIISKKVSRLRGMLKTDIDLDYKEILEEEIIKKHHE
ncbi:DUF6364 family protein [Cognataquiflexum rubidum]|uniref:DUF6364 family protein n=1 Tax=Cognataquiflexum rubidum TaxID=2922273 RepID=UPI001F145F57|nr:DUF6364 family protein [Cognataquiflexum rubidum]MCH6235263.1 DUF6364 family protein [Cognataquiflexum rubidum]